MALENEFINYLYRIRKVFFMSSTNHWIFLGIIIIISFIGIPEDTLSIIERLRYFLISLIYILFNVYMIKFFKNWYNWIFFLFLSSYAAYVLVGDYKNSITSTAILFLLFIISLMAFYFSSYRKTGSSLKNLFKDFYKEIRNSL